MTTQRPRSRARTLLLALFGALLALAVAAPLAAAVIAPLNTSSRWMIDNDRRVVLLHGVNMVNKFAPYEPSAIGFDADDADAIAAEGFNTVRLGLAWKAVEPSPGVYDEAYLDKIQTTVGLLNARGIYTLIDFHQDMYNERFNGQGFPDWAVYTDGLWAWPDVGFPGNYFTMPGLQRAYDNFWNNRIGPGWVRLQDRYAAAWKHVAQRMRNVPGVFGYDIMNEPFPGSWAGFCVTAGLLGCAVPDAQLSAFNDKVRDAIRSVDTDRIVYYEPHLLFDFGYGTTAKLTGPRVGFSFHPYCIAGFASGIGLPALPDPIAGLTCGAQEQLVFTNAEVQARLHDNALLVTEFGDSNDLQDIGGMVDLADKNMVSWQYWSWYNRDPSGTASEPAASVVNDLTQPPIGANVKQDKLDVLARPYPRAVSGTPTSIAFDRDTRRFNLTYKTARPGAAADPSLLTEIAIPARQYPSGYTATVAGGTVTSAPGAPVLKVQALTGVASVSVHVEPSP